ncbi:hypothetical protein C2S53_015489, partial [Perilla frutescens var. hirtella]
IYPKKIDDQHRAAAEWKSESESSAAAAAVVLTVWKKSLVLNWSGFTVLDTDGKLVYRVDNYDDMSGHIFLMDASGTILLTIRRKRSLGLLGDTWLVFHGDTTTAAAADPILSARKRKNLLLLNSKCQLITTATNCKYEIQGSYERRSCAVYDVEKRRRVAEIRQKETSVKGIAFGKDVFRLHVQPGFDAALAMAIVILLDQMFGSD